MQRDGEPISSRGIAEVVNGLPGDQGLSPTDSHQPGPPELTETEALGASAELDELPDAPPQEEPPSDAGDSLRAQAAEAEPGEDDSRKSRASCKEGNGCIFDQQEDEPDDQRRARRSPPATSQQASSRS